MRRCVCRACQQHALLAEHSLFVVLFVSLKLTSADGGSSAAPGGSVGSVLGAVHDKLAALAKVALKLLCWWLQPETPAAVTQQSSAHRGTS